MTTFAEFPKIYRFWEQDIVVTEKIDGTNGLILINEDLSEVKAGSRSRFITPTNDNYGFAKWVEDNKEELRKLGPGYHYGEWWGQGIQRGYRMPRKVFSLFNVHRWSDPLVRPSCCDVVPVVYQGLIQGYLEKFPNYTAVPSTSPAADRYGVTFTDVEGLMLYFTKSGTYMKHLKKPGHKEEK